MTQVTQEPAARPPLFGVNRVSQIAGKTGVVGIIMGDSGCGKTSLIRSLPPDRTLVEDVDGGLDVLATPDANGQIWDGRVETTPKDLSNLKDFTEWVTTTPPTFTTFVVDSVSNLERRMVFLFAASRGKDLVDVKEYGDASTKLRQYLMAWQGLKEKGVNVIFICHTKTNVKGREGVIYPFLSDQLANEILGLVDFCGYMSIDPATNQRQIQFVPTPNVRCKTRYNVLQPIETNPNLASIISRALKAKRGQAGTGTPVAANETPKEEPKKEIKKEDPKVLPIERTQEAFDESAKKAKEQAQEKKETKK